MRAWARLVRSPFSPKIRTMASATLMQSLGRQHDTRVPREVLVARDAAERQPVVDPRRDRGTLEHLDGLEADVVGVLQRGDLAAAVEADVELARQVEHAAAVQDVVVPVARVRPRVEQLLGVDAGRCRTRDVADVVRTGAARNDAEVGQPLDEMRRTLGRDLPNLKVAARRHMGISAAVAVGQVRDRRELPLFEDAVMDPQAAHVAVLGGTHVEQPMVAPAEIVFRLRPRAGQRHTLQAFVGLERVLAPLPLLLLDELLASRDLPVLRLLLLGIGSCRLARKTGRSSTDRLHRAESRGKAFEPVLLVRVEIHTHRVESYSAGCASKTVPALAGFDATQ